MHLKFVPFTRSLLDELRQTAGSDNALYIFPNKAGKRAAIREFQNTWAFQNLQFLTMEELKESLFLTEAPLLKEEKRTLAFYASLSAADKDFFKINNYFQSIELAHHFFDLWEEFNEEVLLELDRQRLQQADAELLHWQALTYDRLKSIKKNYQQFIESRHFTDSIFTTRVDNLDAVFFKSFESIHFVNQFYYTHLERHIINSLRSDDKQVTLYYQLEESLVDKQTLNIRDFTLRDLSGRTEQIDIVECSNEFNMLRAMVQQIHTQKLRHVVNFSAAHAPYARYLSLLRFNLGRSRNLSTTSIFQFLQNCHALLESIIFEPEQRRLLVPIQALFDALLDPNIAAYFCTQNSQRKVIDSLSYLMSQDDKFMDLDGDFFISHKKASSKDLSALLHFITRLLKIDCISSFIDFIDSDSGIHIDAILTKDEKKTTNSREVFYRALADFQAIERLGIIADWTPVFANRRLAPQVQTVAGIFQLFLDYLKSRSIRLNTKAVDQPRVEFVDLQDTRNLLYNNVAVMNVVEKEIPHPRQTPFLFTERQREVLGLKTYDDIKRREKYYFLRLVLTSSRVTLLTQKNIDQNIAVSSFVEEIRLFLPPEKINTTTVLSDNYSSVYKVLFKPRTEYKAPQQRTLDQHFYTFPFKLEHDFPTRQLNLSYYSLASLLNNAFVFYITKVIRLDERPRQSNDDYSPMLIGNIVHECLNQLWRDILQENILSPAINFAAISPELIQKTLKSILKRDRFYYASPHNHAQVYFHEILMPRIERGVQQFFAYLDRLGLSHKAIDILPEQDTMMSRDEYIPYILSDKIDFRINIGGRADLRIEAKDRSFFYIFDYKTGGSNREQLILYELYYYLLENNAALEQVSSFFYHVFDAEGKELREFNSRTPKSEIIKKFDDDVRDKLNGLWKTGYGLPEKKARLNDLLEISRADLFSTVFMPRQNKKRLL